MAQAAARAPWYPGLDLEDPAPLVPLHPSAGVPAKATVSLVVLMQWGCGEAGGSSCHSGFVGKDTQANMTAGQASRSWGQAYHVRLPLPHCPGSSAPTHTIPRSHRFGRGRQAPPKPRSVISNRKHPNRTRQIITQMTCCRPDHAVPESFEFRNCLIVGGWECGRNSQQKSAGGNRGAGRMLEVQGVSRSIRD